MKDVLELGSVVDITVFIFFVSILRRKGKSNIEVATLPRNTYVSCVVSLTRRSSCNSCLRCFYQARGHVGCRPDPIFIDPVNPVGAKKNAKEGRNIRIFRYKMGGDVGNDLRPKDPVLHLEIAK